jgi:uncharacterized protein
VAMTVEYLAILALIAVLSVVQSFFGMGVLVFGTPTLLLMGYDFITILGYLLPASFAISLLQVLTAGSDRVPVSRYLYLLCLPGIGIGLWLADFSPLTSWTNILVGATLLLTALVRFWSPSQSFLLILLEKHLPAYHLVMGLIHGLTNLGGAFLAILASGTNTEKEAIRYTVAHYYLAFSSIQMLLLATIMGHHDILISNFPATVIAALVYLFVGNKIFTRSSNQFYNVALNLFIAVYGFAVLLKSWPLSQILMHYADL